MSLPSRERGLKSGHHPENDLPEVVAPFAGAWIEITNLCYFNLDIFVAPFAGAWIEIYLESDTYHNEMVAPFAGAWIEIQKTPIL